MARELGDTTDTRSLGATLMAGGLLVAALMANHPTGVSGGAMMRNVHGAILLMMLMMTIGFALFVRWRRSTLALAGLVPYVAGALAGAAAGIVNGFLTPSLAEQGVIGYRDLLWTANQQLAIIGVVATGMAYVLWGADLWRLGWRATAAAGAAAGVVPAVLLLSGRIEMGLIGALLAYSANALWAAWLGAMLWRRAGDTAAY